MSKHTPGPWAVGGNLNDNDELPIWEPHGACIALCWQLGEDFEGENDNANMRANAKLIAAAPAMADALRGAEDALGNNLHWLSDALDLHIRQGDKETIARLEALNVAWIAITKALAKAGPL